MLSGFLIIALYSAVVWMDSEFIKCVPHSLRARVEHAGNKFTINILPLSHWAVQKWHGYKYMSLLILFHLVYIDYK